MLINFETARDRIRVRKAMTPAMVSEVPVVMLNLASQEDDLNAGMKDQLLSSGREKKRERSRLAFHRRKLIAPEPDWIPFEGHGARCRYCGCPDLGWLQTALGNWYLAKIQMRDGVLMINRTGYHACARRTGERQA